jgi:hypothetical protein
VVLPEAEPLIEPVLEPLAEPLLDGELGVVVELDAEPELESGLDDGEVVDEDEPVAEERSGPRLHAVRDATPRASAVTTAIFVSFM